MNICFLLPFFIFDNVFSQSNFTDIRTSIITHWVSSDFGSSFASQSLLYDINHDGIIDLLSVSVDGEVAVYNSQNGEPNFDGYWPVYLANDHFFSKSFLFIHGANNKKELIVIISQKGRIYYFDSNGSIVKTVKLKNIYLRRNWSFLQYSQLSEIIFTEDDVSRPCYELYSEVFADAILTDLSNEGVLKDLVIPVSFVTEETGREDVIVSAIVVFDLALESVVDTHLIGITRRESEYPGYLLSNVELLRNKENQLIVTLTSGVIHNLQWNTESKKFQTIPKGVITYNQGPHNCHLTGFCRSRNNTFMRNYLCCVYIDFYGHLAMMDLARHRPMWEYKTAEVAVPTMTKIFVDSDNSPFVVFANSKGWVYCVSLLTGKSKEAFPLHILEDSFSSGPEIISDLHDRIFVILLSHKGHFYTIPVDNPKEYQSLFSNPQIASHLPPFILQSDNTKNIFAIIQSKTGFISKLEIPNFKKNDDFAVHTRINLGNPSVVGTLYGMGSTFSFDVRITDPTLTVFKSPSVYIVKVFINEYLYYTHKVLSSTQGGPIDHTIIIDLDKVNRTLVPKSVFLFGTATILVIDSLGRTSSPDYLNIRINYDFQFELIWIVYLTTFVCCAAILLFHITECSDKLLLPRHIGRDS